jgi:hypothetical protein
MQSSEATNELAAALAKAQAEITNPAKDAKNPHYKSFYADLAAGIGAIRAPLSKNGIAVMQLTRLEGDVLFVDTRLTHASGQWVQGEFPVIRFPAKPQEVGSAMTYARRYSLFALVGIAGEEDDGEAANEVSIQAPTKPEPAKQLDKEASGETLSLLLEALTQADSVAEIDGWLNSNLSMIERLQPDDKSFLRTSVKSARSSFTKEAA